MSFFPVMDGVVQPLFEEEEQYGKTFDFAFATGEFVRVGGVVVQLDLAASLAQAIEKELRTERHTWLAYTRNYGSDIAGILRNPLSVGTTATDAVASVAAEAILHDHRVAQVTDIVATVTGTGPWTVRIEADVLDTFGITTSIDVTMAINV